MLTCLGLLENRKSKKYSNSQTCRMQLLELTFGRFYFYRSKNKRNGSIFVLEIGVEFEGIVVNFLLVVVRTRFGFQG